MIFNKDENATNAKNTKTRRRKVIANDCQNKQTSNLIFVIGFQTHAGSKRYLVRKKSKKISFGRKTKHSLVLFSKMFTSYDFEKEGKGGASLDQKPIFVVKMTKRGLTQKKDNLNEKKIC